MTDQTASPSRQLLAPLLDTDERHGVSLRWWQLVGLTKAHSLVDCLHGVLAYDTPVAASRRRLAAFARHARAGAAETARQGR
jgi:hypothetical protein